MNESAAGTRFSFSAQPLGSHSRRTRKRSGSLRGSMNRHPSSGFIANSPPHPVSSHHSPRSSVSMHRIAVLNQGRMVFEGHSLRHPPKRHKPVGSPQKLAIFSAAVKILRTDIWSPQNAMHWSLFHGGGNRSGLFFCWVQNACRYRDIALISRLEASTSA